MKWNYMREIAKGRDISYQKRYVRLKNGSGTLMEIVTRRL
jgi:hypothetical protein